MSKQRLIQVLQDPYKAEEKDIELLQLWSEKYPAVSMFKMALCILVDKYQGYWSSNMKTLCASDVNNRAHLFHLVHAQDKEGQEEKSLQEEVLELVDTELNKDFIAQANHASVMQHAVYDISELGTDVEIDAEEDLISSFIKKEPSISKPKAKVFKVADSAKESLQEHDDLVTETLAQVFERQGHPKKAIEIYKKLILKNPEKNTYFANIIKNLEKNL